MPETPRRRYQVPLRRVVAGSFLAAATAASLTGFTTAPAPAVPPAVVSEADSDGSSDTLLGRDAASSVGIAPPVAPAGSASSVAAPGVAEPSKERLAGVRTDLDRAVVMRLVTPEQADGFYAQIERRVAAGL